MIPVFLLLPHPALFPIVQTFVLTFLLYFRRLPASSLLRPADTVCLRFRSVFPPFRDSCAPSQRFLANSNAVRQGYLNFVFLLAYAGQIRLARPSSTV